MGFKHSVKSVRNPLTDADFRSKLSMEKAVGDRIMEEKIDNGSALKPAVTIEDASKIEDREVPFEDLISELRY